MSAPEGVFILVIIFHMANLAQYFRDTLSELKQVKWPTQNQAMVYTGLVIGISVLVGLFVGLFDHIFSLIISLIVERF